MDNKASIDLLRGHMDTIILSTLLDGDKYGLEIMNIITESSDEQYTLKQATLYSALKRLEGDGLVESYSGNTSNGKARVYYSLTQNGKDAVSSEQLQWEFSRTIMDKLISDKVFDPLLQDKPFEPSNFRPLTKRSKPNQTNEFEQLPQDNINTINKVADTASDSGGMHSTARYTDASMVNTTPTKQFTFSNEIPNTLREQEIRNRQYHDTPASLDSLFQPKQSTDVYTETVTTTKVSPVPAPVVNTNYGYTDRMSVVTPTISEQDKKAAEALLYATDAQSANMPSSASSLPDKLTHYETDLIIERAPQVDKKLVIENFEKLLSDGETMNANELEQVDRMVANTDTVATKKIVAPPPIDNKEKNQSGVNYISTFGKMYSDKSSITPATTTVLPTKDLYTYDSNLPSPTPSTASNISKKPPKVDTSVEEMNMSKLRSKLYENDITLKPYVKSETSKYYVNKYFYSNKILRDWSYIIYSIFALFCIVSYTATLGYKGGNLGAFLGFMFSGALLPIFLTFKWYFNKTNRKSTNFSLSHSMVTGAIVMLILTLFIILISFFAVKINVSEVKTLINPLILPLISLLLIPMGIATYSLLYQSKRYHLR